MPRGRVRACSGIACRHLAGNGVYERAMHGLPDVVG